MICLVVGAANDPFADVLALSGSMAVATKLLGPPITDDATIRAAAK
jgi:hypothetical protein